MTKQDHIDYWVETAERDWITVQNSFKAKDYVPALFWAHLVLEKLLKAHWVKDNVENHPPKIHNLVYLANKTNLEFNEEDMRFLLDMNILQMEGRYPDYVQKIYKSYNEAVTKSIIEQVNIIRECLLKNL